MKKQKVIFISLLGIIVIATVILVRLMNNVTNNSSNQLVIYENGVIKPTVKNSKLENGLSTVRYNEDYGFDTFINNGGASSDNEVVYFLKQHLLSDMAAVEFNKNVFGCSTISVQNADGERLFGRNFDWENSEALIVQSNPENAYASISTVNMDFIDVAGINLLPNEIRTIAALYAPLDGMNEEGLAVSVNMIQDSETIEQNTNKPDITTTTAIRLLLNKAANVEESLHLLEQYDMHASMNMMIHFAISDRDGRSVVVEYINNEMVVSETPVVTNFYIAPGEKNGVGTSQSHTRYDILMEQLQNHETMSMDDVKKALDSVSKDNFDEFESTEWSIVFNQSTGEVHYYHRENYDNRYTFYID